MNALRSPSRPAALASGLAFGLALPVQELLATSLALGPQARSAVLLLTLTLVLLAPVLLFVVGTAHLSLAQDSRGTEAYRASLRGVGLRGLFWLAGAGLGFALFWVLRG